MIGTVSIVYAMRSLLRHPRRTVLSVLGVGIGCAIGTFATSWIRGATELQVRAASESGAGHLRAVPAAWRQERENTLRLADWPATLRHVDALPGVKSRAMRARANGLLAFGNRTAGVEILGVIPAAEAKANRIVWKSAIEGRYLRDGDREAVVIGRALARRLDVELEDDLLVTLSGRAGMQSAMLRLVGILDTGSRELDTMVCHVTLADVERLTGFTGPGEIAILLRDSRRIDAARRTLEGALGADVAVLTWKEVNPELAANVDGDTGFTRVLIGIVIVVVVLGIASAQLTAVLERRREFAILAALGMKGGRLVAMLLLESVLIGLGGAAAGIVLGGALAWWLAAKGVDLAALYGMELSFGGVLMDPILYGDFGWWIVGYALAVALAATMVASAYPAWFATRTQPADALREA